MEKERLKKYLPVTITLVLVALSLYIIKDFIVALISAFVLAFLIRPVYSRINKRLPSWLSAIISILIIIIIIMIPVGIVFGAGIAQLSQAVSSGTITELIGKLNNLPILDKFNIPAAELTQRAISLFVAFLTEASARIPLLIIALFIIVFGTYYFLVDWDKLVKSIQQYLPVKDKKRFSKDISETTKNIVYGSFLVAVIELLVAAIGFWVLGIPNTLVYSTLIAIFAFVPGLGPMLVWIPLAIWLFIQASYFKLIGVIVIGLILSFYVDQILRAQITASKSKIHPFIMLIGIIGGVAVFGIFGFIIGPIILAYTIKLVEEILQSSN